MNEWMAHNWALWVVCALVSAVLEVALPQFALTFTSLAAGIAALVSLRFGIVVQLAAFAVTSLVALSLLRPRLLHRLHSKERLFSRTDALLGASGQVTEAIRQGNGRVLVAGQDWAARSAGPIDTGCSIEVIGHDGIVLIVKEFRSSGTPNKKEP